MLSPWIIQRGAIQQNSPNHADHKKLLVTIQKSKHNSEPFKRVWWGSKCSIVTSKRCDVYMNATGKKVTPATPPSEIIRLMCEQLVSPVQWEAGVREMIRDGVAEFYECGPMKQLKAIALQLTGVTNGCCGFIKKLFHQEKCVFYWSWQGSLVSNGGLRCPWCSLIFGCFLVNSLIN